LRDRVGIVVVVIRKKNIEKKARNTYMPTNKKPLAAFVQVNVQMIADI
jgi:hypothetical protein